MPVTVALWGIIKKARAARILKETLDASQEIGGQLIFGWPVGPNLDGQKGSFSCDAVLISDQAQVTVIDLAEDADLGLLGNYQERQHHAHNIVRSSIIRTPGLVDRRTPKVLPQGPPPNPHPRPGGRPGRSRPPGNPARQPDGPPPEARRAPSRRPTGRPARNRPGRHPGDHVTRSPPHSTTSPPLSCAGSPRTLRWTPPTGYPTTNRRSARHREVIPWPESTEGHGWTA